QYFSSAYIPPNANLMYRAKTRTNGVNATGFCLRSRFRTTQCLVESLTCTKITHLHPTRLCNSGTNVPEQGLYRPNRPPRLGSERSFTVATLPLPIVYTWFSLATDGTYNKSLDASGGGVFCKIIGPAMVA